MYDLVFIWTLATTFVVLTNRSLGVTVYAVLNAAMILLAAPPALSAVTARVSVSSAASVQGNNGSGSPSISADGRFVAFSSVANNLIANDTNGFSDIFVRDNVTMQTSRISVSSSGLQGNGDSDYPSMSADGRFVSFASKASNLVSNDTNASWDVFIHELATQQTTRVSVSTNGEGGNWDSLLSSISADGRFVAFESRADNLVPGAGSRWDILVRDRMTNQTIRVSVPTGTDNWGGGNAPAISADGRFVAFESDSDYLSLGDRNNGLWDILVRDLKNSTYTLVSKSSTGAQTNGDSLNPSISADGRFIVYGSRASNLVSNDTNGGSDAFVYDQVKQLTTRVSISSTGVQSNSTSITPPNPKISADGRFVTFSSDASNLVVGDINSRNDIFIRDLEKPLTTRASVSNVGLEGNGTSIQPSISADGRFAIFTSASNNLVSGDTNSAWDVFNRDTVLNTSTLGADLSVTQAVPSTVKVGSTFSFIVKVKNLGTLGAAENVVLTDIAPLQGQVSLPPTLLPSQGTCSSGPISICRLGTINAGQGAKVQVTFTALNTGAVVNRVSMNAAPNDPVTGNNTTITSTTIIP